MRNLVYTSKPDLNPVLAGAATIMKHAQSPEVRIKVLEIIKRLAPDDYLTWNIGYYEAGISRFGDKWVHADILTALYAASELFAPSNYLEVGTRRGRSLSQVLAASPSTSAVCFDLWVQGYAGVDNPGQEFVLSELRKLGYSQEPEFISGDSHQTLRAYFSNNPNKKFDLICVDGDHSKQGAEQDLIDVLPHLAFGGVIVFDDICHPYHRYLLDIWNSVTTLDCGLTTSVFTDTLTGVAVGVRFVESKIGK